MSHEILKFKFKKKMPNSSVAMITPQVLMERSARMRWSVLVTVTSPRVSTVELVSKRTTAKLAAPASKKSLVMSLVTSRPATILTSKNGSLLNVVLLSISVHWLVVVLYCKLAGFIELFLVKWLKLSTFIGLLVNDNFNN